MKKPTDNQLNFIKKIITNSLEQLIENDSDIFNIVMGKTSNRKLHETCINHRFAYYLESKLKQTDYEMYNVDIEYNRLYNNTKKLNTENGQIDVRPDIIIHTRMNKEVEVQHLLVVETKKGNIINHDIIKVKNFISDENYNYLFGLTVSYCSSNIQIIANLYYFNGEDIKNENISVQK